MQEKPKIYMSFKNKYGLEERVKMANELKQKFPDMVLVVFEKNINCKLEIDQFQKFSVKKDVQTFELLKSFRQTGLQKFDKNITILYFIGQEGLQSSGKTISEIHEKKQDFQDGILYIEYTQYECFG